jgi:hypothetical protein
MSRLLMGLLLGATTAIALQHVRRRRVTEQSPQVRAVEPTPSEPTRATDLDELASLTSAELYRRAQAAAIRGRASMTKAQLIEALRGVSEQ